ncbi:MAG: hypothetical protein U0527_07750 [Candidatus Eisenbacteria bacterium]
MKSESGGQASSVPPAKCVWMEAGVVDYRLCDRDLDCEDCPFDRGMRPSGTRATPIAPGHSSEDSLQVRGLRFPRDRFYDRHHMWARVEAGARVRVGLDALAVSLLVQNHGVHPPSAEQRVGPGHASWEVIGRAGLLRLGSPVVGRVTEVNRSLLTSPRQLLRDPYGTGWVFTVTPSRLQADLSSLHHGDECAPWIEEEIDQALLAWSEAVAADDPSLTPVMADGGRWDGEGLLHLTRRQHRSLIQRTLRLGLGAPQDGSHPAERR